ncbi:MAG: hypothetical protein HQL80_03550 [Magnetococcales bacterium]|nr:hypothetical protein [Magnetococcales bacterium]
MTGMFPSPFCLLPWRVPFLFLKFLLPGTRPSQALPVRVRGRKGRVLSAVPFVDELLQFGSMDDICHDLVSKRPNVSNGPANANKKNKMTQPSPYTIKVIRMPFKTELDRTTTRTRHRAAQCTILQGKRFRGALNLGFVEAI